MSKIKNLPSQEYLQSIYDYEQGNLIKKIDLNRKIIGSNTSDGYKTASICGKTYLLHRLIWKYHTGLEPIGTIDHINKDRADNRIENLRDVSSSENQHNKGMMSNNTSGIKGVCWNNKSNRWQAIISIKQNKINLGFFENKEDAIKARREAELKDWSYLKDNSKEIIKQELSLEYLLECVRYHEDGYLIWNNRPKHHFKNIRTYSAWESQFYNKPIISTNKSGYVCVSIKNTSYKAHNLIYWLCTGERVSDGMFIDHINNIRNDNRIENLRLATRSQNSMNRTITAPFKGVSFDKEFKKWRARITINKKTIHLGRFNTPDLAHNAYKQAALELHGEYANFG